MTAVEKRQQWSSFFFSPFSRYLKITAHMGQLKRKKNLFFVCVCTGSNNDDPLSMACCQQAGFTNALPLHIYWWAKQKKKEEVRKHLTSCKWAFSLSSSSLAFFFFVYACFSTSLLYIVANTRWWKEQMPTKTVQSGYTRCGKEEREGGGGRN